VAGPVTVGAFPTAIRHLVVPATAELAATAPSVSVRIRQFEPEPGRAALRTGELDLLVVEADAADPLRAPAGLVATKLLDDPYRIVVPRAWGPVSDLDVLRDRPWVDGPPGTAVRRVLDRLCARHGLTLDRRHECLEFPAALSVVAAGLAAAVIPALAQPEHHPGVRVIDSPLPGARRLELLHRRGRHEPTPAARLLATTLTTP
jgi:DNA-binding transcriptional LysR family regulator